jgi:hypothetical protein
MPAHPPVNQIICSKINKYINLNNLTYLNNKVKSTLPCIGFQYLRMAVFVVHVLHLWYLKLIIRKIISLRLVV